MTQVVDESVLTGNSAILKCIIPSFVADFVSVQAWVDSEGKAYYPSSNYGNAPCSWASAAGKEGRDGEEGREEIREGTTWPSTNSPLFCRTLITPAISARHRPLITLSVLLYPFLSPHTVKKQTKECQPRPALMALSICLF